MPDPTPNLFTNQVIRVLQELSKPRFEGAEGSEAIAGILDEVLTEIGTDVSAARVAEYRKLYHAGWERVLDQLSSPQDRDLMTERFRELVF